MGFIKDQVIDIIDYLDASDQTIVTKYIREDNNNEIKQGANLIVREGQAAVFVKGGRVADIFFAGTYVLSTDNLPIISKLSAWQYGFESPLKSDVYFVSLKQFTQNKWGTATPLLIKDEELGLIHIRGYGQYSFKIKDAFLFMQELVGTLYVFETKDIVGHFSAMLLSTMIDTIGESKMNIVELTSSYLDIAKRVQNRLNKQALNLGIEFNQVAIESLSVTDEVAGYIDKNVEFTLKKNSLDSYSQYQSAKAIELAAGNEGQGGMASLGAGLVFGKQMMEDISGTQRQSDSKNQVIKIRCNKCGELTDENDKFCSECGTEVQTIKKCKNCGTEVKNNGKFCSECGEGL